MVRVVQVGERDTPPFILILIFILIIIIVINVMFISITIFSSNTTIERYTKAP